MYTDVISKEQIDKMLLDKTHLTKHKYIIFSYDDDIMQWCMHWQSMIEQYIKIKISTYLLLILIILFCVEWYIAMGLNIIL